MCTTKMISRYKNSSLLLILMTCYFPVKADIFSCMVKINASVSLIRKSSVTSYIANYIMEQRQFLDIVKTLHGKFSGMQQLMDLNRTRIEDPVGAFKYVWSTQIGSNDSQKPFNWRNADIVKFDKEYVLNRTKYFPTLTDMHGSGDGILAIQEVHGLKAKDVAEGNLGEYKSRPLTFRERMSLAVTIPDARLWVTNEDEYSAIKTIEWLEASLNEARSMQDVFILEQIFFHAYKNLSCVCSTHYLKNMKRLQSLNPNITLHENCTFRMPFPCQGLQLDRIKLAHQENFETLCRGEIVNPENVSPTRTPDRFLKCRLSNYNDPRLLYDPVKEEELNLANPRISILHEILNRKHVEFFKRMASRNLRRGPVASKEGAKRSYHKISQEFVIRNTSTYEETENLVGRLSAVSKTHIQGFEDIMVVNYGTGGLYGIHMDGLRKNITAIQTRADNNRLVTIVTYMNDVKSGGETVFPHLGIKVKPEKYGAVMFFNLYKNGEANSLASHSSCPIVYGEKWIANQWIQKQGQEFTYLCSDDKYE